MELLIKLDKDVYKLGENVSGFINISSTESFKHDGVEIRLRCIERFWEQAGRYSGWRVNEVFKKRKLLDKEGIILPPGINYPFSFKLPNDAPPSYKGNKIEIVWKVEAKIIRRFMPDLKTSVNLQVYNFTKLSEYDLKPVSTSGPGIEVYLDKPTYNISEPIKGRIKLTILPKKFRGIYVEVKAREHVRQMFMKHNYDYMIKGKKVIDPNQPPGEYEFILEPPGTWPMSFSSLKTALSLMVNVKVDIPLAPDINLSVPILCFGSLLREVKVPVEVSSERSETKDLTNLEKIILEIMSDGKVRDLVDIKMSVPSKFDIDVIKMSCRKLVERGLLEVVEKGYLLEKYRIKH